jgi:hypothetical protein
MKTFEIKWRLGGATLVQADSYDAEGMWYRFFREGKQVTQCAKVLVRNIQQLRGLPREPARVDSGSLWRVAFAAG